MECLHFTKKTPENDPTLLVHRARFYDFVNDMDRRHNRNFLATFPEMTVFYEKCKAAKAAIKKQ